MKKMPTLFVRDFNLGFVTITQAVTPGCEWAIAGEGTPSRKWDGTAILVRDSRVYRGMTPRSGLPRPGTPKRAESASGMGSPRATSSRSHCL